jgi:phosphate:Na+ symporter
MLETYLSIAGGLALFLYAVNSLSEVIQGLLGDQALGWIRRFTRNLPTAILSGAVITTLLDSSSAVIILTIVLVNARLLTFRQAMGIVMGANIGTTVSSQIISMDIGKYSPIFLVLGLLMLLISKNEQIGKSGKAVLYFGILFFGLYTMERAVEPLRESPVFFAWMEKMKNPLTGTLTGAVVTLIIQSSSATVGMAIVLAKKGIISLAAGVGVMMGAELGTVSDTLLATIKGSRQALKTGLFHLIFNLLSIISGLLLFYPFLSLITWLSTGADLGRTLANAHMLFNILGVLVFVWFCPWFERGLEWLLPEKEQEGDVVGS